MKSKTSQAFSLVELSIIILIVGIVIAGVTEGSRLLKQMRLSTARNLTTSSDIRSIENMILWLDATSETSLTTDFSALVTAKNTDDYIHNWDDQNPQVLTSVKPRFSQSGDSSIRPVYKEIGINNIPTLYFGGSTDGATGDALFTALSTVLNPSTFTLFAVTRPMGASTTTAYILYNQGSGWSGFNFSVTTTPKFNFLTGNSSSYVTSVDASNISYNVPYISTFVADGTNQLLYRNGTSQDSDASVVVANTTTSFRLGCANITGTTACFNGYISEIIMFDRALSTEERNSVTKYLGKKYAILVAS